VNAKPIKPLAAAVAAALSCPALAAQPDAKVLDTVVVAASRSATQVEEMPLHTTVVSREDIDKSPAQTLDQLLRNVPGMNFAGIPAAITDPTGHQTRMRGLGNAKVLVLLDGVPIHDPFYLTTQWFKVPLSNIERVEIVRGGNSSLWGNMAAAGVVNIVSRRPRDNGGEVTLGVGTQGTTTLALSKNFVAAEALTFNLSVDNYRTDGYQTTLTEYRWRSPQKSAATADDSNIQLAAFFKPGADIDGYLRLGYHIQDQDLGYRRSNNLQRNPDIAGALTRRFDDGSSLAANAWAQYVRFEKYNGSSCYLVAANDCRNSNSSTLVAANAAKPVVQFYSQYGALRYREQGGSLVYAATFASRWTGYQLGVDYRHLSATDAEQFYSNPGSAASPQGKFNSSSWGEAQQTFAGLFVQTRIMPIDSLELTFSGRYDSWRNADRVGTRTTAAGVTAGGAVPNSDKSSFNPSLAARYELNAETALRAVAYKAFRAPGFNNTTRTFGTFTSTTIANPDLGPERLTGWEIGADYRGRDLALSATGFIYRIKDMIATYTVNANAAAPALVQTLCGPVVVAKFSNCSNASSVKYYTNDQDGQSHGIELTGRWRYRDDLSFDVAYTHTESYLTRRGALVTDPLGVQIVGLPKDVASLGATWRPVARLRTYAELRYIGPLMVDTTSLGSALRARQGGNTVVNVSVSYAWDAATDVFLSASNLLDHRYSENGYIYNQPYNRTLSSPLAVVAGLKLRF